MQIIKFNLEGLKKNLDESNFDIIYETEKHETGDNVIGEDGNDAIYIISRKKELIQMNDNKTNINCDTVILGKPYSNH